MSDGTFSHFEALVSMNKGCHQTARMRRLFWSFTVCITYNLRAIFLRRASVSFDYNTSWVFVSQAF